MTRRTRRRRKKLAALRKHAARAKAKLLQAPTLLKEAQSLALARKQEQRHAARAKKLLLQQRHLQLQIARSNSFSQENKRPLATGGLFVFSSLENALQFAQASNFKSYLFSMRQLRWIEIHLVDAAAARAPYVHLERIAYHQNLAACCSR